MACPICKSNDFYTKDPEDEYEIYEFKCENGRIQYEEDEAEERAPQLSSDSSEVYCQRCAWHGKISAVK